MAGKTVNPTRMELTRLKGRLKTASRGHKLLKDKRDEQMRQFMILVRRSRQLRAQVEQALAEAKAQGIHGKETTPFLLAKVKDLTGGDSLESNIQLVYNNAVLGAKTACALAALKD